MDLYADYTGRNQYGISGVDEPWRAHWFEAAQTSKDPRSWSEPSSLSQESPLLAYGNALNVKIATEDQLKLYELPDTEQPCFNRFGIQCHVKSLLTGCHEIYDWDDSFR